MLEVTVLLHCIGMNERHVYIGIRNCGVGVKRIVCARVLFVRVPARACMLTIITIPI